MDNSVETIIEVVASLIFVGVMLVPFLAFFVYVFYQTSKRKKIRSRAQDAYGHVIGSSRSFPVRYASEPRFRSWLKVFPWEGTGLMVPVHGVVTFVGEKLSGTPLNLQFGPANST